MNEPKAETAGEEWDRVCLGREWESGVRMMINCVVNREDKRVGGNLGEMERAKRKERNEQGEKLHGNENWIELDRLETITMEI